MNDGDDEDDGSVGRLVGPLRVEKKNNKNIRGLTRRGKGRGEAISFRWKYVCG